MRSNDLHCVGNACLRSASSEEDGSGARLQAVSASCAADTNVMMTVWSMEGMATIMEVDTSLIRIGGMY